MTKLLRHGKNTFHVVVFKWCDGSYLEDQDKFRFSGIFREVFLLVRDEKHVKDVYIQPSLDDSLTNGKLKLETVADTSLDFSYRLLSPQGKEVAVGKGVTGSNAEMTVSAPDLWNDEAPLLYTLVLHCGNEYIAFPFGFKSVKIKNGIVFINGKKVKARGINRHDSHPILGVGVAELAELPNACGVGATFGGLKSK